MPASLAAPRRGRTTRGRATARAHQPSQRPRLRSAAAELEAMRLDMRARRMSQVVRALRDRKAATRLEQGAVPPPLSQAIRDFERELSAIRLRLAALGGLARH